MIATANCWLALLGALALTKMAIHMDRRTCHTVRIAVVLLFAGMVGDFLSLWLVGWGPWVTTAQYLGVIFFIAANRRDGPGIFLGVLRWVRRV